MNVPMLPTNVNGTNFIGTYSMRTPTTFDEVADVEGETSPQGFGVGDGSGGSDGWWRPWMVERRGGGLRGIAEGPWHELVDARSSSSNCFYREFRVNRIPIGM